MCLSAALILLIWGFFRTVEIPEEQGGGFRRSPSGLALLGAAILLASSMLRIQNESYHLLWFMILPTLTWLIRRFFQENKTSRIILAAATVVIGAATVFLWLLPENPEKAANIKIVREAAQNTLTAIENGNASAIRDKYDLKDGIVRARDNLFYWAETARNAALLPVNPAPPATDTEVVEKKTELTIANSILGYWLSIISFLIGTLVVTLAPYYIVLKMDLSQRCKVTFFGAITLMMINLILLSMYTDDGRDYKSICRLLPEELHQPGGTVRSAKILKYWLKNSPNNPGLLRRYFDGSVKLPQEEPAAAGAQKKAETTPSAPAAPAAHK